MGFKMTKAIRFRNTRNPVINFKVILDRKKFLFSFSYNYRDTYWYMSIQDEESYIVKGIRVLVGWPLLKNYVSERLPKQQLMVVSLIGVDEYPTFEDFGINFILVYGDE
jgi:hypothetical protein